MNLCSVLIEIEERFQIYSSLLQRLSCVLRVNSIVEILSASVIPGDAITAPIVLITVTKMHAVFDS